MKNLKIIYGVIALFGLGFFFGQLMATGKIDLTIGGLLIGLFILPALVDLKFERKNSKSDFEK